jgi:hypothetical protein
MASLLATPVSRLLVLGTGVLLAACEPRVDINATANVPADYASVLITVEEVWFNESATAAPADTSWQKFELDDTVTFDLVDVTGGKLTSIASDLKVAAGTYRQIRVLLASRDDDLHDSAEDVGATYNNEVTWFDEDGDEHTSPLEVLNPDQGVGIEVEFEVEDEELNPTTVQLVFDAARDLTEFRYSGETGFLLNPTLKAFDAADPGTIRGALNLQQIDLGTPTGRPQVQVIAERLDEALGRRVVVASTAVSPAGAFVLYPLPLDDDEDTTEYDLVIHGPEIQTIVIRDVPVSEETPQNATPIALGLVALQAAESFEVNVTDDEPVVPRGARIGFYQTLPDEDEPHLIELAAVDPLRGRFARPMTLSRAGTISYGDYGGSFELRSGTPEEGAARYSVAALSPHHGEGALAETLLRPASPVSDTASFSVPAIGMPGGAVPGTVSATVTVENPGRYDRGVLMVTREGAVVTIASLDDVLQQALGSAFVDVTQVPAGSASASFGRGLYYLEAWTWDSDDPEDTFRRHPGTVADLRAGSTAGATVTIR